jgi:transposase
MNQKGQWCHAKSREIRSNERKYRKEYTRQSTLLGESSEEIANSLGIGTNTVKIYLKELQYILNDQKEQKKDFDRKIEAIKTINQEILLLLKNNNSNIEKAKRKINDLNEMITECKEIIQNLELEYDFKDIENLVLKLENLVLVQESKIITKKVQTIIAELLKTQNINTIKDFEKYLNNFYNLETNFKELKIIYNKLEMKFDYICIEQSIKNIKTFILKTICESIILNINLENIKFNENKKEKIKKYLDKLKTLDPNYPLRSRFKFEILIFKLKKESKIRKILDNLEKETDFINTYKSLSTNNIDFNATLMHTILNLLIPGFGTLIYHENKKIISIVTLILFCIGLIQPYILLIPYTISIYLILVDLEII